MKEQDATQLERHPKHEEIYKKVQLEESFIDDIERNGIRIPIKITPKGVIISGHRRWKAAQQLGHEEVPVEVQEYESELEEREAIVSLNQQRIKTFSQRMREAIELEEIERKRAKQRQGDRTDVTQNFAASAYGSTREKIGDSQDWSHETYRKAKKVWTAANNGADWLPEHRKEKLRKEIKKIDQGEQSIHGAYKKWQRYKGLGEVITWEEIREVTQPGDDFLVFEIERRYNDQQDKLCEEASWKSNLQTLLKRFHTKDGYTKIQAIQTFSYLLERDGYGSVADEYGGYSMEERKDADRIEELSQDGISPSMIGLTLGVVKGVVRFWMKEENIPVQKKQLPDSIRQRIE